MAILVNPHRFGGSAGVPDVPGWNLRVSDNFTGPTGSLVSTGQWAFFGDTSVTGSSVLTVVSDGTVRNIGEDNATRRYRARTTAYTFGADQAVEFTLTGVGDNAQPTRIGAGLRGSTASGAGTVGTGLWMDVQWNGTVYNVYIMRQNNTLTYQQVSGLPAMTAVPGDTLRLELIGNLATCKKNGTPFFSDVNMNAGVGLAASGTPFIASLGARSSSALNGNGIDAFKAYEWVP